MGLASGLVPPPPEELLETGYGVAGVPLTTSPLMTTGAVQPAAAPVTSAVRSMTLSPSGQPAIGSSGVPAGTVTTGPNPYAAATPTATTPMQTRAITTTAAPYDPNNPTNPTAHSTAADAGRAYAESVDNTVRGGSDGNSGWDSVYHANENLGPMYMNQYGAGADARLADLQMGAVANSYGAGSAGSQIGQAYGNAAYQGAQAAGGLASTFGQGAAQSLVNQGAAATAAGQASNANALKTQQYLNTAANAAGNLGTGAGIAATNYANQIGQTAGLGTQAAQLGQNMIQGAVGSLGNAGEQSANAGFNAANQINQAAQGIAAAGQAGMQTGQQGQAGANAQAGMLQNAGQTGQRAISSAGQTAGQMGMNVANQGQQFLGQQGYQANLGESNQARALAQQNAAQLAGVESNQGPSAAQAQLRQGLNQAQSANLAMARSGRGFGGSASALSQAQNLNAQAGQQAANQSAMLRSQEDAAFRQRQAANYQAAGGINLQAGQQALSREQMLAQQQLAQQQANQSAYLQAQGIGQQGMGQQISAEQAAYQQLLAGQQASAGQQLAGAQLGMQGAGMNLSAQQAYAQAAAQAGQMGLAGLGQNITAQQAAAQAGGQYGQLGIAGANQALAANTAAGQMGMSGYQAALQGNQQMQAGLQAGGQMALAGGGLNQQAIASGIGATNAAATQGLAGILGGGQLGLAGAQAGGQLGLAGNQQWMQGVQQAGVLGLAAEQQRAANTQYSYGLNQANIANDLQIAGMQAGLNVQNAGFTNQAIGAGLSAGAAGLGALAMLSDVNAKTDIVPLGSGRQPQTSETSEPVEAGAMTQGTYAQSKPAEQTIKISIAPQGGGQGESAEVGGNMAAAPSQNNQVYSNQARQALASRPAQPEATYQGQRPQMGGGYQSPELGSVFGPRMTYPQMTAPAEQARQAMPFADAYSSFGNVMQRQVPGYGGVSDVNAKTEITPLGSPALRAYESEQAGRIGGDFASQARAQNMLAPHSGDDPYGIDFGADLMKQKGAEDKKKRMEKAQPFVDAFQAFGDSMQGGGNYGVNPITGLGWGASPMSVITPPTANPYNPMEILSDERAKYGRVMSDERAKDSAGEMVSGLDPYAFRYKDPERHGQGVHFGIMAQDLERSPAGRTVVEQGADGLKRVNTPKLTMLNSAGLAQHDDRLTEIEQRIANMGGPSNGSGGGGKSKKRAA